METASVILCIDTALEHCGAGLIRDGVMIDAVDSDTYMRASEILHRMIDDILKANDLEVGDLSAVALNGGPGSYTGLRIGASSAKGFCYALGIKLIHLDGLALMTEGAIQREGWSGYDHYIPMIDARRKEVYTAVYDSAMQAVQPPGPVILAEGSFSGFRDKKCLFFGNGAEKASDILEHDPGWSFRDFKIKTSDFERMAWQKWLNGDFADAVHYTPSYLKKFHFISSNG